MGRDLTTAKELALRDYLTLECPKFIHQTPVNKDGDYKMYVEDNEVLYVIHTNLYI